MMVCIIIVGAGVRTEAAHYCMGHTSFASGDSDWTVWESLLVKGVLKDVPKCITIMHVVLIKHDDHREMMDLC